MYCYVIKMKGLRSFLPSMINIKAKMSTNSNSKNHYETLELKQSATHNEIKSAYYKLTMQYHPDKNKTDSAKEKFRDVAEAYEILGNRTSRMTYDRKNLVRTTRLSPQKGPIIVTPPTTNIYKTRKATSTDAINMDDTAYNYEEWAQAHYRARFRQRQRAKANMQMIEKDDTQFSATLLFGTGVFIIIYVLALSAQTTNYYDVPMELSKTESSVKNAENESNIFVKKK